MRYLVVLCFMVISAFANQYYQFRNIDNNIELGMWSAKVTGDIKNNSSEVSYDKDLGYGKANNITYFQAGIDHSISWLPDIRITVDGLQESQKSSLTKPIVVADQNYTANINNEIQFSSVDMLLYNSKYSYYSKLRYGLDLKYVYFQNTIKQVGSSTSAVSKTDGKILLPYVGYKYNIDMINTVLEAEVTGFSIGDIRVNSLSYGLKYYFMRGSYLSFGYKKESYKATNNDDDFFTIGSGLTIYCLV